ncbi:hypothetical protein D910_08668 [Dendroctonus ponderosae]
MLSHVDRDRPIFLLDQLLDVADAIGDDVVEHQGVEPGDLLLWTVMAAEAAQQNAIAQHEEHQLESL